MARRRHRQAETTISLFSFQDIITGVSGITILVALLLALKAVSLSTEASTQAADEQPASPTAELEARRDVLREQLAAARAAAVEARDEREELMRIDWETLGARLSALRQRNVELAAEVRQTEAAVAAALAGKQRSTESTAAQRQEVIELAVQADELRVKAAKLTADDRLRLIPDRSNGKRPILAQIERARIGVKVLGRAGDVYSFGSPGEYLSWLGRRDSRLEYVVVLIKPEGLGNWMEVVLKTREMGFDVGWEPLEANRSAVW